MGHDHDMLSVVAQITGLTPAQPELPEAPIPPEQLIERFTDPDRTRRLDAKRCEHRHGFCGLNWIEPRDAPMITGFDEGYQFMGFLSDHGWRRAAAKGDWPYVVYMIWSPKQNGMPETSPAICRYLECDFDIWCFDEWDALKAFYKSLPDAP